MSVRTIVLDGDPILRKCCHKVEKFDARLHSILDDMKDTMLHANGVGLAGPQIGILRRICVVLDTLNEDRIIELINPEVIAASGEQTDGEGCLSFPGKYGYVTRPDVVTVRAQDRNGEWFEITGEHLTARAFLHEIDHLDGHVFVEKVTEFIETE